MRRIIALLTALVLSLSVVGPASADASSYCNGNPGVKVWQDANKGGPHGIFCWTMYGPWINYQNLANFNYNLNWGANWNDRISSYTTFNMEGHTVTFYADAGWSSASVGGRVVQTSGNQHVPFIGVYWEQQIPGGFNDRVTSFKFTP
jgi:hypothetical protein